MSQSLYERLAVELHAIPLIDPHTHINPHAAASTTLADIMGYHYYTELAHSAGLPKAEIEQPGIEPRDKVRRLIPKMADLENTVQYSWLIEILREFFGFQDKTLTEQNWAGVYDAALAKMRQPDWERQVLQQSRLEGVFLTNDFDDPLTGFDTRFYIPCLRTDDLVFHLGRADVRQRLAKASGIDMTDAASLRKAIGALFQHFTRNNAKACAISLPPDFEPAPVHESNANGLAMAVASGRPLTGDESRTLSSFVFWTLAEFCVEYRLPFDLMIGVNRRVYEAGVFQGQDLFDQRTSLIQYRRLFNAFPTVMFPISVLSHAANQELVSYSWIFPNVLTNGHWWYSNTPVFIELDTKARLQAVPRSKQVGYYSDMYKLEFALPKFNMYRRVLAKVLADDFIIARRWTEEEALALGRQILRGNVETLFGV